MTIGRDPRGELADITADRCDASVRNETRGGARRAIDSQGVFRFVPVNHSSIGRNPDEVIRVLDARRTHELLPCRSHSSGQTLTAV